VSDTLSKYFQALEMMESLRRLVWKVESLSKKTSSALRSTVEKTTRQESGDYTSPSRLTNLNNHHNDNEALEMIEKGDRQFELNGPNEGLEDTHPTESESVEGDDVQNSTSCVGLDEMTEIAYMFPVRQETPLGEWMMGKLKTLSC
jgi:hypothetical protein